jgi:demethylmenaquinone methyltransferase / 2-methoxy-6-polyprenyl-1,4-benzoquinol methylase
VVDISKSPARIAGMFDAIARRYDFLNHFLSAGLDRRWRRRAIASLRLTGSETLLDVCAGTGDVALAAAAARPGVRRVVGVDFAGEMLRIGRGKIRRAGLTVPILLARGDAMRIPLRDATVDGVTIAFGIRNVEDPAAACAEIARVLAPGGRLAILEFAVPTLPVMRPVFLWYFHRVLPRLGGLVSGHRAAYSYLPASVDGFATPEQFVTILRQTGFRNVRAVPLTLGVVYLYTADGARGS